MDKCFHKQAGWPKWAIFSAFASSEIERKKDRYVTSEIPTPVCDIWQKVNKRSYENSRSIIDVYAVCVVKGELKIPFCLSDAGKTRDFCVA